MSVKKLQTALFSAVLAGGAAILAQPAQATYGQIMQCIGTNNCGMAGAGLTIAQDATSAALNPALGARLGNEAMFSMGWFNADVSRHIEGTTHGYNTGSDVHSAASNFFNGSAGVNYRINDKFAVNLSFYPGGGGATDWGMPRTGNNGGAGGAADGQDHQIRWRMFNLQPSISWSPTKNQSYGFGVTIVRADMKTDTLSNTFGRATNPGIVDVAYGAGFNIGTLWDINDQMSFAVDYQSRVWMERFEEYKHAFPSTVDRPAILQVGMDFKEVLPNTTIALDYKWINQEDILTMQADPNDLRGGFGWKDIHVVALGVQHALNSALTVRAGWSYGNSPINKNVFANILFPAIVEHHLNAGASMKFSNSLEFGASAYITPMTKLVESGDGKGDFSKLNADAVLKHQQFGAQLSVNYSF